MGARGRRDSGLGRGLHPKAGARLGILETLSRLACAVWASTALCVPSAWAAPRAAVEGELDPTLRAAVVRAVGETDRPIQNRFEARRRAAAAAEDAIAVLRSEGYYAYVVEPDLGAGEPAQPLVRVSPGEPFLLGAAGLEWQGAAPVPEAEAAVRSAVARAEGARARAIDVVAAEGRAVAALEQRGYADVAAGERRVVVDHAIRTLTPTYRLSAGQLVRLDGIDLVTNGRTNPAWLRGLAPWRSGETFQPDDVAELERRLLDTGVYDSVTVALAPADRVTAEGLRPVIVSVADRRPRTVELGASYSTGEGLGVDARYTRYNLLRRADTLAAAVRASTVDSRAGVDLTLPHWRRAQQTLKTGAAVYRLRTDAFDETGVGVRLDVIRRYGKTSYVTAGASADVSRTKELRAATLTPLGRNLVTLGTLADAVLDRSDDPLDPRRGYRLSLRAEPTVILGSGTIPYLKLQTQGSAYLPLGRDARTVLAGRLKIGSIVNGAIPEIPASRRFFAGGGGSVRGYPYQGVGPRLADNTPQGGLSLIELSLEARQDLTERWGVVGFVDAGVVGAEEYPGSDELSVGVGLGARYDLGFGPIRVDVAFPVTGRNGEAPFQVYVSIGQSF